MSNRTHNHETIQRIEPPKPLGHIAREGETEYAAIMRMRSGMDAGNIDFGCRVQLVADLHPLERKDIIATAAALHESICENTEMPSPSELASVRLLEQGLIPVDEQERVANLIRETYFGR